MEKNEILRLENVRYRYANGLPFILDGINCGFESGKTYALVGESGTGKTTMISLIGALDRPTEGKILYNGYDVSEFDADRYRANHVSIIFQSYNLLFNYNAIDNIGMILNISGACDEREYSHRADELLDEVGIPVGKRTYPVQNLSGGERQRVAIARAIASGSQIILADEPTGNLDPENSVRIMDMFSYLAHDHGKCVIIATHSEYVSNRCELIYNIHQLVC